MNYWMANKFDNLLEMDQYLETYNKPNRFVKKKKSKQTDYW